MGIGSLRRVVQLLAFIVLLYAGFFITTEHLANSVLPFISPPEDKNVKMDWLTPRTGYDEVFDAYLPVRTCRYVGSDTRLFRACAMHFLTEVPIYGVPFKDFLPHLLFFLLLAFLLSRMMCGWLCPLGALQDFMAWIRLKMGLSRLRLPRLFYTIFERFRYAWLVFLFIVAIAIVIPSLGLVPLQKDLNILTCNTCPGRTVIPLVTGDAPGGFGFVSPLHIAISLMGLFFLSIFLLSFFGKRLWCKVCPTGALLSIFNKGSAVVKEKDVKRCTKCGICERICPMDNRKVYREKHKKYVNDANCINCFRCVDACPEDDCLKAKFFRWTLFRSRYANAKKTR